MMSSSGRNQHSRLNFLILAYKYPPFAGVGARRMASLVSELVRSGHNVDVVTVDWSWVASLDYHDFNPSVHVVPSRCPHRMLYSIADTRPGVLKVLKQGLAFVISLALFWDDEAQRWGQSVIPKADNIIQSKKIDILVATGHPFQVNYLATKIKDRNPFVFLVQDFRDPWEDSLYSKLLPSRAKKLYQMKTEACVKADLIVTVTDHLKDLYCRFLPHYAKAKVIKIPNGYDSAVIAEAIESRKECGPSKNNTGGIVRLSHIGNITNGRDVSFLIFLENLKRLKKETKSKIKIELAGYISDFFQKKLRDEYNDLPVSYLGRVSHLKALELAAQSDFLLHFGSKIFPDALSTKIYEYGALRKPTISFNFGGEIEGLIRERSLGYSINVGKNKFFFDYLEVILWKEVLFEYRVSDFSYKSLTNQYLNAIEDRRSKKGFFNKDIK